MRKPRVLRGQFGDDLLAALPGWIVARVAVAIGLLLAVVAADELRDGPRPLQLDQGLFAWDAAWYRDIAEHGYGGVAHEGLRFFPLLPLLARWLSVPLLGSVGLALVIIVNVAALATGVLLHRLVREETGNRLAASRASWLVALLPPAVVLVLGYAEAVALALVIGAFLLLRKQRWWAAAGVGVLLGLCRPTGMLLALPAVIEVARGWRTARGDRVGRVAAVVGAPVGTALYLAWVEWQHGAWDLPLRLQNSADLRAGWDDPISAVWGSVEALVSDGRLGDGLHVPWIGLFAFLLVVVFVKLPSSYGWFSVGVLALALSAHNLGSFERYGLFAFPLVIALAIVSSDPRVERGVLTACGATLCAFTALIFVGAFVP